MEDKQGMKRTDIRMDDELLERLDNMGKKMSLSRSAVIRLACIEWLEKKEQKNSNTR